MKSIKQIAVLVKDKFNDDDYEFSGLCGVICRLSTTSKISNDEYKLFNNLLKNELINRNTGYRYREADDSNNGFYQTDVNDNNKENCFIWKPYVTVGRNRFLNKLIKG